MEPTDIRVDSYSLPLNSINGSPKVSHPFINGSGYEWVFLSVETEVSKVLKRFLIGPDCIGASSDFSPRYIFMY